MKAQYNDGGELGAPSKLHIISQEQNYMKKN